MEALTTRISEDRHCDRAAGLLYAFEHRYDIRGFDHGKWCFRLCGWVSTEAAIQTRTLDSSIIITIVLSFLRDWRPTET